MVIKFIESTYDSVKDKLKNPFYGTLFVVWVIRNREFIYNVFFNDSITSDKRLELIREHFLNWSSLLNFLGTILISLGLMILIYASLNLSRFIVELSERILKPWIQQLFSKTSIVSREDYIQLEKERDYFQKKYSEERIEKIRLQRELDEIVLNNISDNNFEKNNNDEISPSYIKKEYNEILDKAILEDFSTLIALINDLDTLETIRKKIDVSTVDYFLSKNIVQAYLNGNTYFYKFTALGEKLRDYHLKST
ncbi:hypothetical protein SAMN04487891_102355 [Flagellimonas taeanensis]|uniref:Uncharacterized protein n=1 Tax=Flagellimonas taeanensis TaxID=1005926 RepID=A0A1M6S8N7_9FLAO|nr:hypothetical protein [Allomuricauda taeanensis]SFB79186.1 hypothetical protein SAMN04487891_102355 [Allomuricauda taeanensis]SHK41132.1 hypothetical protein SAMN05216293_1034 [Allomuricauda taeanensis]